MMMITRKALLILPLLAGVIILGLGGCTVSAYNQTGVSRAGMQFSDSPHLAGASALLSSVEPGTDDRGGASASGCTVCQ